MIWKMKLNKLVSILTLAGALVLPRLAFGADSLTAAFEKGNVYYSKGNYQGALNAYKALLNEGYESAPLYYNIGNAYYKLGEIPSALLYYEKAHKLAPGDDDINFNIRFTNLKTTDKIDEVPEFFLANWWKKIILSVSISTLSVFSVLFVLLASAALIFYFFAQSVTLKKTSFYISVTVFTFGLLTLFISGRQSAYFNGHKQAIIFTSSASVKNGPVSSSGTLFVLHEGTKLNVLDSNNGWLKIRLANGNEGWIKAADVQEI